MTPVEQQVLSADGAIVITREQEVAAGHAEAEAAAVTWTLEGRLAELGNLLTGA